MNPGKTQGYVLTFRCINCGKYEVFANYRTEHIVHEDRIRDVRLIRQFPYEGEERTPS